jgi:hypothetical protein
VSLLKNESSDALAGVEVLPTGDKFLIISAPLEESDMSTVDDKKELAKMWTSTKWKKKVVCVSCLHQRVLLVRILRLPVVASVHHFVGSCLSFLCLSAFKCVCM